MTNFKRHVNLSLNKTEDYLTKLDLIDTHPELFSIGKLQQTKKKFTKRDIENLRVQITKDKNLFASRSPRFPKVSNVKSQNQIKIVQSNNDQLQAYNDNIDLFPWLQKRERGLSSMMNDENNKEAEISRDSQPKSNQSPAFNRNHSQFSSEFNGEGKSRSNTTVKQRPGGL